MPDQPSTTPVPIPSPEPTPPGRGVGSYFAGLFVIREAIPVWQTVLFGLLCIALCFGLWWYVTRDVTSVVRGNTPEAGEQGDEYTVTTRILPVEKGLPSPTETFESFPGLWFDRELTRNTYASLRRVALGFGLSALIGIPLGVLAGCFTRIHAFFNPLAMFGRNIPIAALIPLLFSFFGISELQKVLFIFLASVAFVFSDTARAVQDVGSHYIDTAYTLGASSWQVVMKVLVPLALPSVFNSLRLLFGLAFGYIMLSEVVVIGEVAGGLGSIINVSQRVKNVESMGHIILILLIIPLVALVIDRLLYWVQRELFPYRYGGAGVLHQLIHLGLQGWDDLKSRFWQPTAAAARILAQSTRSERATP